MRVGKVVKAFEFDRDAFNLETALVPSGIEDATCVPFTDSVVEIASVVDGNDSGFVSR